MLNVLIALGIFATILVFLHGCAALHRAMTPKGKDRAIERRNGRPQDTWRN